MFPGSFPHWHTNLDSIPSAFDGVRVAARVRIDTRLAVVDHLVLVEIPLDLFDGEVGGELVTSDKASGQYVSVNQIVQRSAVAIWNLDKEAASLRCSFNPSKDPHSIHSVASIMLTFSKF